MPRRLFFLVLVMTALVAFSADASELLAPTSGTVLSLNIAGRQSAYYRLALDSTLEVKASGPGTLTAIVRLALPAGFVKDSAHYRVLVQSGVDTARDVRTTTASADAEWVGQTEQPGLSRKFSFTVETGLHTYHVRLLEADGPYCGLRFQLARPAPHADQSPLYPVAMDRTLTLIYHERRLDYHLATPTKPVKVRAIGPTRLRVVTRLVYGATMKGTQKYALNLALDAKPLKPEELSTTKAVNSEFEEEGEWVPGKSRTIYVAIPPGEHELGVTPTSTDAPGVALRFTLPADDVGNEEKD